jgi:DNA-binding response OmpR family regulator
MAGVILEVLFVPRKADSLSIIRRVAETMELNLHICSDPDEAERLLFCHRYDGLILDHDARTEGILRALRQSPSSRGAIAIDVHDESIDLQTVFAMGANFEIVYPLNQDRVRRTLNLAVGLMMLGRRRYYRHPVEFPARLSFDGVQIDAVVSNVSEQGIGLRCEDFALKSGLIHCSFVLPDNSGRVMVDATVVWADRTGQAGCRIEQFAQGREQFTQWLSRLFHQQSVAYPTPVLGYARTNSAATAIGA